MLPTITIEPIWHKNSRRWALYFPYNTALVKLLRRHLTISWSSSKQCWYADYTQENLNTLLRILENEAIVSLNELPEATTAEPADQPPGQPAASIDEVNVPPYHSLIKQLELKAYSPNTIRTYANEFGQFLSLLGSRCADDLTPEKIKDYIHYCLSKLQLSENTVHSRLNALKFYYEQVLGREKFFIDIPRPKRATTLPKVISEEKILAGILTVTNLKHRTLLLMAYSCGLRVSEAIAIKMSDIDRDRMQLFIERSKGKKDRVVPLALSFIPFLEGYIAAYKPLYWLFENQTHDGPYSTGSAQTVFRKTAKMLGLPAGVSFHSLRHSYATHMLENGIDISVIQKLLGHNDLKTTLRYLHVSNRHMNAIENPLDALLRKHKKLPPDK